MPEKIITLGTPIVDIAGYAWIENVGAFPFTGNQYAGTRDKSLRMEGFEIDLVAPPGTIGLRYIVYVENIGWMDWVNNGTYAGTKGQSLRCEAFIIEITGAGPDPLGYAVTYMAHQQDNAFGDIGPFWGGQLCGTVGASLRLEGMAVSIVNALGQTSQS